MGFPKQALARHLLAYRVLGHVARDFRVRTNVGAERLAML
jgi:hypothetical protein